MHCVLLKVNNQLKSESRSIALLMDNAGCHPQNLSGKYSNIKILFLSPNTTSVLQPLDLGIINNFKVHYRKLLMQYVLAKIEECSSNEVVKSVNILLACRWVAQAWELVSSDTIKKCVRKAGVINSDFDPVSRYVNIADDPFADLEADSETGELEDMIKGIRSRHCCSADEFTTADKYPPVCQDYANDSWEDDFLADIAPSKKKKDSDESQEQEDEEEEEENGEGDSFCMPVLPKLTTFHQAMQNLDDVATFLDYKGYTSEATEVSRVTNVVAALHCSALTKARQTTLDDYFHK